MENGIIELYLEGATLKEIMEKYKIGQKRIYDTLEVHQIPRLLKIEQAILRRIRGKATYQEAVDKVIDNYVNKKMGQLASGKEFNLNQNHIEHILDSNNIRRRSFSEAASISSIYRSSKKNDNYFSEQSADMAWLLGFIAADGTLRKKGNGIKITLASVDREILERIKEELEIELSIKDYQDSKGYFSSTLEWSSAQQREDLKKYHIIPEKTFKLKWPTRLKKEYWNDYIRGYFDGDGSINIIKSSNGRGNGSLRWQVCSATKEILEYIVSHFEEQGVPSVSIQEQRKTNILYTIQYSSTSTRLIYDLLYTNSSSNLFLKRKKDHYEDIMGRITPLS